MVSVLQPARALFDPFGGLAPAVQSGRWVWPVVVVALAVSLSGAAVASRWDASSLIAQQLQASGELQSTTEQERAQKIITAERVRMVGAVAKGVFLTPIVVIGLAALLKLAGWLFETPIGLARCFAPAALALLPIALFHLILGAAALRQPGLADAQVASLVPSNLASVIQPASALGQRLLSAVDLFNFWSAALLGLGFAESSGMRRSRGVLLGFAVYVVYVAVFVIGLPEIIRGPR